MKQARARIDSGLLYLRDSGGKHELTPSEYVSWAIREADRLGVKFAGTPETVKRMIKTRTPVSNDIFLDYCVQGNAMSRPALDAMRQHIKNNPKISHVFIPRRDRLARPDDPMEGVLLEKELRESGITLVFMNQTLEPLKFGQRQNIGESIAAVIDYHQSGEFRSDLAEKMIYAQLELAKHGFSTEGRAPFGFRRFLMRVDGTVVRQLADGEIVRQAGHHVVWLPESEHEIAVRMRILEMLVTTPASSVARILNEEGVPSPDYGRTRTDNGVSDCVSGTWNQSTIINIARHPLNKAICQYGLRSMGDQRRMTPEGPRFLEPDELTSDRKPRVIRNSPETIVTAPAHFEPLLTECQADQLTKILDDRAGTQRGKPRSRERERNPLSCRIFDMNCTWPMYRVPYSESFRYTCGKYQQTRPRECAHNHVDGMMATRYAVAAIRQRLLRPGMRERLEEKLRNCFSSPPKQKSVAKELNNKQAKLEELRAQLANAKRNVAFAATKDQFEDISQVVAALKLDESKLSQEIARIKAQSNPQGGGVGRAAEALQLLDELTSLLNGASDLESAGELFKFVNLQFFLKFEPVQKTKRIINEMSAGILTWGNAPSPIEKYTGATSRKSLEGVTNDKMKNPVGETPTEPKSTTDSDRSAKSLGNLNRADRI